MLTNLPLSITASLCFGLSTVIFKHGIDTGDQRYTMAAAAILFAGYAFYLQLLQGSMSAAVVLTSMLSQILTLLAAFFWFQEPMTASKAAGLFLAAGAVFAFSLPTSAKL